MDEKPRKIRGLFLPFFRYITLILRTAKNKGNSGHPANNLRKFTPGGDSFAFFKLR